MLDVDVKFQCDVIQCTVFTSLNLRYFNVLVLVLVLTYVVLVVVLPFHVLLMSLLQQCMRLTVGAADRQRIEVVFSPHLLSHGTSLRYARDFNTEYRCNLLVGAWKGLADKILISWSD